MKLSILSIALVVSCAFASNISVVIKTETLESHPASACVDEMDIIKEELLLAMGIELPDPVDNGRRELYDYHPACERVCSQFPNHHYCFTYVPFCAQLHGYYVPGHRGLLSSEKADKTVACAKAIVAVEGALVELADFVHSDVCRGALVYKKKEYECFIVGDQGE